jgi:hypothetical protein
MTVERHRLAVKEHPDPFDGSMRPSRRCDTCSLYDNGYSRGVDSRAVAETRTRNAHACGREWLLLMLPCGAARRRTPRYYL